MNYLELVDLLRRAGVSRRLNDPRSVLAGVEVRSGLLLLLFRVEEEDARKLDSKQVKMNVST